jgi:hypothetical protein
MHPQMDWRGRRTWRFWKRPPSCQGPEEAREVLRSQIEWRHRHGDHDLDVERLEGRDGRVAAVLSWAEQSGRRHEWAQVLELREGMIVDIRTTPVG